jgi:hypothetical protein
MAKNAFGQFVLAVLALQHGVDLLHENFGSQIDHNTGSGICTSRI